MKMEIFLRMDGVTGMSKNYAHRGWTDISSWHWGMHRVQKATNGNVREAVNMNRITIIKPLGIESPMFMKLFAERTVVESAEISVAPPVAKREAQQKYIDIALEKILIQSIETGADISESDPCETIVICFGKVTYEFFHNVGAVQGGTAASSESHRFEWDLGNRAAS